MNMAYPRRGVALIGVLPAEGVQKWVKVCVNGSLCVNYYYTYLILDGTVEVARVMVG